MCSVWPRSNRARPLIVVCGGQVLGGSLGNTIENDYSVSVRRPILIMILSRQAMWVVVNALGHVMAAYELPDKGAHRSHCNPVNPAIESAFEPRGFVEYPVFASIQKSRCLCRRACWAR